MTSFTYTWNSAFLAIPANNEQESLGAQRIRDHKAAFSERFAVCFSLAGDAYDGLATTLQFRPLGAPSSPVGQPTLFTYNADLYYQYADGTVLQLTNSGAIANSVIPSGTRMSFLQAAVPVGWTHDTSLNDCLIRINSGTWEFATDQHALAISEIPNHSHNIEIPVNIAVSVGSGGSVGTTSGIKTYTTDGVNGATGGAHTHTINGANNWRPPYTDSVVGVKN
jgi:hypothetical protein